LQFCCYRRGLPPAPPNEGTEASSPANHVTTTCRTNSLPSRNRNLQRRKLMSVLELLSWESFMITFLKKVTFSSHCSVVVVSLFSCWTMRRLLSWVPVLDVAYDLVTALYNYLLLFILYVNTCCQILLIMWIICQYLTYFHYILCKSLLCQSYNTNVFYI